MKNKKEKKSPFFANFLEKQVKKADKIKGGDGPEPLPPPRPWPPGDVTMRYPSDDDFTE